MGYTTNLKKRIPWDDRNDRNDRNAGGFGARARGSVAGPAKVGGNSKIVRGEYGVISSL